MRITRLAAAWIIAMGLFLAGPASSQEPITLGLLTKPGSAQNVCAERFKSLLESRSPYRVTLIQGGALGTEIEILKQIQAGAVHMGVITSGPFDGFLPEARVIDFPYLFDSYKQADKVLEGPLGTELLGRLERVGFKGLAFSENGFRHVTNSIRPVHAVGDVKGLRMRVMESAPHEALWRLFEAIPVPMGSLTEVAKALRAGSIDGEENPLSAIWSNQFYEGQKYLSLTGHIYSAHIAVANLKWFSALPEKDRALIGRCMREAAKYEKRWSRKAEAGFLKKLKTSGLVVDEKPDTASFRTKAAAMADLDIFKEKDVTATLRRFQEAARAAAPQ